MPTIRVHTDQAAKQRAYRERQKAARQAELEAKHIPATAPIPTMPSMARWKALQAQAQAALQAIQDEMEAYRDERSEQWQESDRAQEFQTMIDRTEEARSALDDLLN